jgi:hypothetical protein
MSVSFDPSSGSTVAFGSIVVGTNANLSWTVNQVGPNNYYQTNSIIMTGPQAAQFSAGDPGPIYGHDTGTGPITYTPTTLGAATATMTVHYELGTFTGGGLVTLDGIDRTIFYNLTGTGIANPNPPPATETTSLLQSFRYLLVPTLGTTGKVLSYYDTTSFNDTVDACTYIFKAEDIIADRVPTTRRVMITYIDLGVATLFVTVSAVNDNGFIVTQQVSVTIGTVGASGLLSTAYFDLAITGYRPQVSLTRAANGGPVFISHVMATGTIEKNGTL